MKRGWRQAAGLAAFLGGTLGAMATQEASFEVVQKDGAFELRDYAPQIVAEVVVDGSLEEAGNKAFRRLFRYISGANRDRKAIAMTSPVSQEAGSRKIAMTAPVSQERNTNGWTVSFMMPSNFTMETIPEPTDPGITLREIPARRVAALRYSGTWSEERYLARKDQLEAWLRQRQLEPAGPPIWARYNPPFTPWFLRRNEILIPIASSAGAPP